jgi:tetratricopeptide (TPR) repeat protein
VRTASIAALALLSLTSGCGVIHDMRTEYVANRHVADARAELDARAPRYAVVEHDLDVALRLRPADVRLALQLAALYQQLGRFRKALRCYQAASAVEPDRFALEMAVCRLGLGERESALGAIEGIMARAALEHRAGDMPDGQYAVMLNLAGYTMVDEEVRIPRGCAMIEEAARLLPLEPSITDSLGWGYFRLGRYREAAFHLERAARLMGQTNAEVVWHLGAVHARLGQRRRATAELDLALELDPANRRAQETLDRLGRELPPPART